MAETALTPVVSAVAGIALGATAIDSSNGNKFTNDGKKLFYIKNAGSGSVTATFTTQATIEGEPIADRAVAVANGAEKIIGPFNPSIYNNSSGVVIVSYTGAGGDLALTTSSVISF